MLKYIIKMAFFFMVASLGICGVSIKFDPAHIFSDTLVTEMAEDLNRGNIVSFGNANIDERVFQERRISNLGYDADTYIIGSSRVMYLPITEDNWYNTGVSAAILDDYYGIFGIIEANDKNIKRVIIGVDPWTFNPNTGGVEYKSIIPYIDYEKRICEGANEAEDVLDTWNWEFDFEKIKIAYSPLYFRSALIASRADFSVKIEDNSEIGLAAKILPTGQRIPEDTFFHTVEKNEDDAEKAVDNGNLYYISGFKELDKNLIVDFELLIEHMLDKEIEVEFFLPAWYPKHYEEIKNNMNYAGVLLAEEYIRDFAAKNNIIVRGAYDPSVCSLENTDFMDTLHLKEGKLLEEFSYIKQ